MRPVEIEIRTALVKLHRQHVLKLLEMTKKILLRKQEARSESEYNLLQELLQQVAKEAEAEQKAMMEWAMESPLVKVTPIPLTALH